jgi:hypothetical protein
VIGLCLGVQGLLAVAVAPAMAIWRRGRGHGRLTVLRWRSSDEARVDMSA